MVVDISDLDQSSLRKILLNDEMFQRTNGQQGVKADFCGTRFKNPDALRDGRSYHIDYSGMDFSGMNCSMHSFFNCDLMGTSFKGANLSGAKFIGSDLREADFSGAFGVSVNMSYTRQYGTRHDKTNYQEGNFDFADGMHTSFRNSSLIGISMCRSSFQKSDFQFADLSYANLKGAKLDDSNLSFSKLDHADGTRVSFINVNGRGASFDHMLLREAKLLGLNADEVYMASVMLVHAQHNMVLAQFGPIGKNSEYVTFNIKDKQVSVPGKPGVMGINEFERVAQKDTALKPAISAFHEAQKIFEKQKSSVR